MPSTADLAQALDCLAELAPVLASLPDEIEAIRRAAQANATADALLAAADEGLRPDRMYRPAEAARFLGVSPATLRTGDYALVPRHARNGAIQGVWVMHLQGLLTWEEAEAYVQHQVASVLQAIR